MTSIASDLHAARTASRAAAAVAPRGPASFVWGDFVTAPGTVVTGAAGTWEPLPAGERGLRVTAAAEDGVEIGGAVVNGTAALFASTADGPTVAHFADGGEGVVFSYDDTAFALQVWNPRSEWARRFASISAYEYDPTWVVDARIAPVRPGRTLAISHHRDPRPVDVPIVAEVRFQRQGREHVLLATTPGADQSGLTLLFTDETNGDETYAAGRVLRIIDATRREVTLDFNETSLLPCAFSLAWSCPIPAAENALGIPVRAGERHAIDHDGKDLL
ncbi:DUF1684 domain-containing protein [Microbacterium sp. SORGH_AS_0862]|uniref:DUF1684 domain-containing protein n=1 Tax=Microbacterium sp. SORGH_AS_0862 TaxID=3041789 RepID=UPI00278E3E35|nr:DUF1684 domain-containing protein [Microbacterium sp. SORGH_AS_0862]MDQ1205723.1 uncharacterized protein (DUF1684 family) [Microbacterium sp. SORGH_AS_0862]